MAHGLGLLAPGLGGEPNPCLWSGAQRSASLDLLLGILGQCSIHGEGRSRGHGYLCAERGRLLRGEGHEDVPLLVPEREEERLPAGGQPELDDTWSG